MYSFQREVSGRPLKFKPKWSLHYLGEMRRYRDGQANFRLLTYFELSIGF